MTTIRQASILQFIRDYWRTHSYSPSLGDLMDQFSIVSPNGVACHLRALEKQGLITMAPRTARSIVVVGESYAGLLGKIDELTKAEQK